MSRPADTDPNLCRQAESLLRELASGNSGLEFEIRDNLINNEVTPDMKVVVFLERPENLGSLAASAPSTQFVAMTDEDWNPDCQCHRYPAAGCRIPLSWPATWQRILAPNFRVGALLADEDSHFNQAFVNGVYYYCGNCASQIYPLNKYPVIATRPAGSPPSEWQAAFDEVNASKVNVLYVSDAAASPELFTYLSSKDVALDWQPIPT